MNRSALTDIFSLRRKSKCNSRDRHTKLRFESLEDRRLLSGDNLLIATLDSTGGRSVLAYSDTTALPVAGGAYTTDLGTGQAQGMAVAPDGSYYVSASATFGPDGVTPTSYGEVVHFSSKGEFLGVLGANDGTHASIVDPGVLAFGPDGNLYVADLGAGAIYQFNVSSTTQQFQQADTLYLNSDYYGQYGLGYSSGFTPGGFTFAPGTSNLIVGDLDSEQVVQFNTDGSTNVIIAPGADGGIGPASILALTNGNLLIADLNLATNTPTSGHHQVVEYHAVDQSVSQFANITTPLGTGDFAGAPSQPESLLLDSDGNLLVGVSPDHNGNGAVLKYNITTRAYMSTVASGIGTPTGLALTTAPTNDILFGTTDATAGNSVKRYSDVSQLPVPGGVASTGAASLQTSDDVAAASDGSYYVSSASTGTVLHYSNSGLFLGDLGSGDYTQAPLEHPGALAFGPNGNLYVADTGTDSIYQFDTSSAAQQYQLADTLSLGFAPGGIGFTYNLAADGTFDLLVINSSNKSVVQYNSSGTATTLFSPGANGDSGTTPIVPTAILSLANGNLLVADSASDAIWVYNASTGDINATKFIDLTILSGGSDSPTALAYDTDGNLLVGVAPSGSSSGAVLKFDIGTGALLETIASGITTPAGIALVPSQQSDLLVGTYDPTDNQSVLRYSYAVNATVGGGVPFDDHGLIETSGVAVAPDGSYYVSTLATYDPSDQMVDGAGAIIHYSSNGTYLNQLDDTNSTLAAPGTLEFGPNGYLYVADLYEGVIYEFDTSSGAPEEVGAIQLPTGVSPAGFTFADNSTRDLIVSDFNTGNILQDENGTFVTIVNGADDPNNDGTTANPANPIIPLALLSLSNGDLLIADSDLGYDPTGHAQILELHPSQIANTENIAEPNGEYLSTFIPLTTPVQAGTNYPPQPTSMLLEPNGDLLVALAPDQSGNGAVEEFDISGAAPDDTPVATLVSSIGAPAGMAFIPPVEMTVPAADQNGPGLTIARTGSGTDDDALHVYQTGTTTDAVASQGTSDVGNIQVVGEDNAINALTIDFGGGDPLPPDGVSFYGGLGTASNTLSIEDAAGGDAYVLNGSNLAVNGGAGATTTNLQTLNLSLGHGSLDLAGDEQTVPIVNLLQGNSTVGTFSSDSLSVQSGTIASSLTFAGSLTKDSSGTTVLSGTNNYPGGTTVTEGTLEIDGAGALPAGMSLTIGSGTAPVQLALSPQVQIENQPTVSGSATVNYCPASCALSNGWLVLAYNSLTNPVNGAANVDYQISKDGGQTWSEPVALWSGTTVAGISYVGLQQQCISLLPLKDGTVFCAWSVCDATGQYLKTFAMIGSVTADGLSFPSSPTFGTTPNTWDVTANVTTAGFNAYGIVTSTSAIQLANGAILLPFLWNKLPNNVANNTNSIAILQLVPTSTTGSTWTWSNPWTILSQNAATPAEEGGGGYSQAQLVLTPNGDIVGIWTLYGAPVWSYARTISTDGGVTWAPQTQVIYDQTVDYGVATLLPDGEMLLMDQGNNGAGQYAEYLYSSSDLGLTWTTLATILPFESDDGRSFAQIGDVTYVFRGANDASGMHFFTITSSGGSDAAVAGNSLEPISPLASNLATNIAVPLSDLNVPLQSSNGTDLSNTEAARLAALDAVLSEYNSAS